MKYFIAVKHLPNNNKLYLSKWSTDEKECLVNPKIEYAEVYVELFSHREGHSDLSKWMKENNYEVKYVPESWFDWNCCGKVSKGG